MTRFLNITPRCHFHPPKKLGYPGEIVALTNLAFKKASFCSISLNFHFFDSWKPKIIDISYLTTFLATKHSLVSLAQNESLAGAHAQHTGCTAAHLLSMDGARAAPPLGHTPKRTPPSKWFTDNKVWFGFWFFFFSKTYFIFPLLLYKYQFNLLL